MSLDVFANRTTKEVYDWYERLATKQLNAAKSAGVTHPMAGPFLLHYLGKGELNGKRLQLGAPYSFPAPPHLRISPSVTSVLAFHRRVFLTETKANYGEKKGFLGGKNQSWAGLIPRLKDKRWDGVSPITIDYESLSDIAPTLLDINALQNRNNPFELDIFHSLRGWQLKSVVFFRGGKTAEGLINVTFQSWGATGSDDYDFNGTEGLTLPNPDYGSKDKKAIAPDQPKILTLHRTIQRLEAANLAKPFKVQINRWEINDLRLRARAKIDPLKKLG
jgi:hypothetical protein